ncbi:MAG TPA: bifunctional metallophosphatase/5'-nucleotidase [Burkholderiaceae bacterium]
MSHHRLPNLAASLLVSGVTLLLAACAAPESTPPAQAPKLHELTIFAINDFHGNIQSESPTPLMPRLVDTKTGQKTAQPAGGIAYLASAIKHMRAEKPGSVLVAAGDLIGASPQLSALLADEPTLAAFAQLDLTASALGNHELDAGLAEFKRKAAGVCPAAGCPWPGYRGVGFPFLAANMLDEQTGKPVLPSYVIKNVDGVPVAFVGAITRDTPANSLARNMVGLRFIDEADALNALVPELKAKGAKVLVAVMHEGAEFNGEANDPGYVCAGIKGRGVDIAERLDPAYAAIISGHTHRAYNCKINGRLLTQAGSFGGWITQITLKVDDAGHVLDEQAVNRPVLQATYEPDPAFAALAQKAADLTAPARNRPVAMITQGLRRTPEGKFGDAALGNLISDAQLAYARKQGPADLAFINLGGIRTDLTPKPGKPVTVSDLFSIQPFHNELVALTLSGAQLRQVLERGLPKAGSQPRLLQPSGGLRYQWRRNADGVAELLDIQVNGKPLDPARDYRVVVNGFLADGGESLAVLREGRDRKVLGVDLDALIDYLAEHPEAVEHVQPGRIVQLDDAGK